MTQKIDYTEILDDIGCQYGDVAIVDGKEWNCWGALFVGSGYYFFKKYEGPLYSDDEAFKPTAIWRRKFLNEIANSRSVTELSTKWQLIWLEAELSKPKHKITIEVEEGAEVLVNGKRVEV